MKKSNINAILDFNKIQPKGEKRLHSLLSNGGLNYGYPILDLLSVFDETFNKGHSKKIIDEYLGKFSFVKKWMLFSDYALYDKNKKNDVISFVLIPNLVGIEQLATIISNIRVKDLKKTKNINEFFLSFINDFPLLSFNFVLESDRYKKKKGYDVKKILNKFIDVGVNQNVFLTIVDYSKLERYNKDIIQLKKFKNLLLKNNISKNKMLDLIFLGQMAGYIVSNLAVRHGKIETFCWISDKDAFFEINQSNFGTDNPLIRDIFGASNHYFNEFYEYADVSPYELLIGTTKNIEFLDEIIKIPDYLAGALADWDYKNNSTSSIKINRILEELHANSTKHLSYKLDILPEGGCNCGLMDIIKLEKNPL